MISLSVASLTLVAPLSPLRTAHASTHSRAAASSIRASSYFIGIDSGTQSTKALVYDTDTKEVLGVGAVPHGLLETDVPGRAEQDPAVWVDAMFTSCATALDAATKRAGADVRPSVKALAVSGQQHGMVALDASFAPIRPAKLWCDTESAPEAAELATQLGWGIVASFTSTKLLWLKRNEPENFGKLAHVALPHDYLNLQLTGSLVMECGDASGTGLLDTASRQWDDGACAMVDGGLRSKLPPLVGPTESAGALGAAAAERLGLPAGLPVAPGGGDNMMSALGCGCSVEGRVAISLGTSGTIFARTAAAARDPTGAVCPFLDATGGGLPLLCTLNCAAVPEEARAAYGLERDAIVALAEAEPIGCEGLTLNPYLAGERTPNWPQASGALVGLRAGHLARPGLVYRAAVEGVAFSLRDGLEAMRRQGLGDCDEVRLVGGGSKSAFFRRVIADALQMRVACPAEAESAALGAALQAAAHVAGAADIGAWIADNHDPPVGENVLEPDPAAAAAYDAAFALYRRRGESLFGGGER